MNGCVSKGKKMFSLLLAVLVCATVLFGNTTTAKAAEPEYDTLLDETGAAEAGVEQTYNFTVSKSTNTALVLILLLVMFSPSVIRGIFYRAERLIVELRLWKESGARREKMEQFLAGYQGTVSFLKENKKMIGVILGGTFLQRFTVFVLTYVVYRGLGLSGTALLDIVFVQASVYIAVDMLPIPGAQGITEAMYICVFGDIFTGHYLAASMCITRGVSFYTVMVIGAAVFAAVNMRKSKKRV